MCFFFGSPVGIYRKSYCIPLALAAAVFAARFNFHVCGEQRADRQAILFGDRSCLVVLLHPKTKLFRIVMIIILGFQILGILTEI